MPACTLLRVSPDSGPWPLHDTQATRHAEHAALAMRPPFALMASAGLAVARLALALAPHARCVQIWAGPGNNGGDGLVAARHLHAAGRRVRVNLLGDAAQLPSDAAQAHSLACAAGVDVVTGLEGALPAADLVIDALLGLGARRAPQGLIASAIAHINAGTAAVLAVDLPSGLHADTGALLGGAAVRAHATLTLLSIKPGCCTAQGRDACGELWLDTLGTDPGAPTAWLAAPPASPPRHHASHKGSHGDVLIVGGAPGMVGAAWLAGQAALAAGAGRVYVSPLADDAALLDPGHPELMGRRQAWQQSPDVLAGLTVACGCGGGDAVRAALPALLSNAGRLVLDADGLNAVATDAMLHTLLRQRATRGRPTLLTPHPLEAARLLQTGAADVQADRYAAAAALSTRFACAVLLKGSGTIVSATGQLPLVNPTGNAALATAGTGDVLAGWAAGLWAQAPQVAAQIIGSNAAWQHGRAADGWRPSAQGAPLRASDLVEALAQRAFC
jgi:hydroxyethylthiazole kinase-like uncharacterized protein yjeF